MNAEKGESSSVIRWLHYRKTTRLRKFMKIAATPLLFLLLTAATRGQSALDGFDPNANDVIGAIVVQPDGKILIGGSFSQVSPNGGPPVTRGSLVRLNPDGTLDSAFNPNVNLSVSAIALQTDGKVLIGGYFTFINGQPRRHIARLDATTGLPDLFDPHAEDGVFAIKVQADGKILVGGNFNGTNSIGGQMRNFIARLDAGTGLADSLNPNPSGPVYSLGVQPDGKILAGGTFQNIGGQARNRIARLDPTTGLADSFDPNASSDVKSIAVQADGKILVGGVFNGTNSIGGQTRNFIARLDATTGLADSFNPNATNSVYSIGVQADGNILAGGSFTSIGGQPRRAIARLNATTGVADSFDPNPTSATSVVYSLAMQADGKVLVGGNFTTLAPNGGAPVTRNRIARLETDGRADRTLDLSTVGRFVRATAIQPDGKILIGGNFTNVLGVARNSIARLNTDGTLDTAFNPNADFLVYSIALQADGKILVGGDFSNIGGQPRRGIARLDAITGLADSFNPNPNSTVNSIAVQADGKILVGGTFGSIGGQTRFDIARLDATTGLADSFNPGGEQSVGSIVLQADGKILVGGDFFNIGGQPRSHMARLDPVTGLADSFNPNANGTVLSIAVQADGKILAGGLFSGTNSIGGQARNRIARLDATTGLADSFDPNAGQYVNSIAVQADGKILVGGAFFGANSIGGQPRNFIARLDPTTGLADSFNPDANDPVISIGIVPDGKILVGGNFATIGGQPRNLFARLTNDTAAQQNLVATQTTVTWTRGGSSPQLMRVAFESSTDRVNYTFLGNGTAAGSNWTLTGLNLPIGQNIYIRARGHYRFGGLNGSDSITESVWNVFLAPPTITSANNTTFAVGSAGTFSVTTSGNPTGASMSITETGALPAGVTFTNNNNGTATLAGTPAVGTIGTYPFIITANNGVVPNATQNFALTVTTASPTPTPTPTPSASPTPSPTPGTLGNISTRLRVLSGDNALIGGLIATGTTEKRVIIRAIGPSLIPFGVPGALANPTLDLFQGSTLLSSNDDWNSSAQQAEIAASGLAPSNSLESAIIWMLTPGQNYTAVVRGINGTTGIGVVEAFDLDQAAASKLGNISTRGFVDVDDNVMIAGLIAGPSNGTSLKILVRALGPTLSDFGVAGALANPTLDLVNASGTVIRSNNNWKDDPQQRAAIEAAGLAPSHDEESALVETVAPGAYTAVVRGSNRATGVGLVEAYNIP